MPARPAVRLRGLALQTGLEAAAAHRRRLEDVAFIGITGSAGKTTTKELSAAILSTRLRGRRSPGSRSSLATIGKTVLRTSSHDEFCVIEIPAWTPGSVARAAGVVQPRIAVVTNIGRDHHSAFRTLEATASEKGTLLDAVVSGGAAVLNADDPHVMGMATTFPGRVLTFGCGPSAMLRAEQVNSAWPERLRFTLRWDGQSLPVSTRLCGTHWVTSVLAAFGTAAAMGIPLEEVADAVAGVEPFPGRMSPVSHGGVTFIRDDWKAPEWSLNVVIDFLANARAARKILVVGTISEGTGRDPSRYASFARRALSVSDLVLFAGPKAKYALGAKDTGGDSLRAYAEIRDAARFLADELRDGDLVVVKGSNRADHLLRVVLAQTVGVKCWRAACGKGKFCSECSLLHVPERQSRRRKRLGGTRVGQ